MTTIRHTIPVILVDDIVTINKKEYQIKTNNCLFLTTKEINDLLIEFKNLKSLYKKYKIDDEKIKMMNVELNKKHMHL